MWVKAEEGAGTLFSEDATFFHGWDSYDPPCDCQPHDEPQTFCGKLDFWISDCFTPVLTIHNFDDLSTVDMTHSAFRINRGWTRVGYSLSAHDDIGTDTAIYHNNGVVDYGYLDAAIFKAIGDDFQTTMGALAGSSYFFQGFMYDFRYSASHFDYIESDFLFTVEEPMLINCDWNQYLDFEGECEECDATCTSGCTSGDVCYECHASCRTCTGHEVHECVDCWCGAERAADGCCYCDGEAGFANSGDKCQQQGCFTKGCDACNKGQCIHCAYGYDLQDGACRACRENDCTDYTKFHLPTCAEKGVRHDTGICNCGSYIELLEADNAECRVCSMGCDACFIAPDGRPKCSQCMEGYVLMDDMDHLCVFLQDEEAIPFGFALSDGVLYTIDNYTGLFNFDLTKAPYDQDQLYLVDLGPLGFASWGTNLRAGYDRRDSVNHETRGMWFDGKYDYLIMDGILPPRIHVEFWTKPVHDGTLMSVSATYDEAN